jgi:hypothetical protein
MLFECIGNINALVNFFKGDIFFTFAVAFSNSVIDLLACNKSKVLKNKIAIIQDIVNKKIFFNNIIYILYLI